MKSKNIPFISPAYWASLFSLLTNLILIVIFNYNLIELDMSENQLESTKRILHITSLILVFIYIIHFYLAVLMQTYTDEDAKIYNSPPSLKITLFICLFLLIFLSGVNTFFIGYSLFNISLIICILQSLISLLTILFVVIWKGFKPKEIKGKNKTAIISEFFHLILVLLIYYFINSIKSDNDVYLIVGACGITTITFFVFLNDWLRVYSKKIKEEYNYLKNELLK